MNNNNSLYEAAQQVYLVQMEAWDKHLSLEQSEALTTYHGNVERALEDYIKARLTNADTNYINEIEKIADYDLKQYLNKRDEVLGESGNQQKYAAEITDLFVAIGRCTSKRTNREQLPALSEKYQAELSALKTAFCEAEIDHTGHSYFSDNEESAAVLNRILTRIVNENRDGGVMNVYNIVAEESKNNMFSDVEQKQLHQCLFDAYQSLIQPSTLISPALAKVQASAACGTKIWQHINDNASTSDSLVMSQTNLYKNPQILVNLVDVLLKNKPFDGVIENYLRKSIQTEENSVSRNDVDRVVLMVEEAYNAVQDDLHKGTPQLR